MVALDWIEDVFLIVIYVREMLLDVYIQVISMLRIIGRNYIVCLKRNGTVLGVFRFLIMGPRKVIMTNFLVWGLAM